MADSDDVVISGPGGALHGGDPPPPQGKGPNPGGKTNDVGFWPNFGLVVLLIVFVAFLGFFYAYSSKVGYERLGTIEHMRPILVVAAVITTLTFGGALIVGSLFASDADFATRFRSAREIFLVFSGVFGTVVGFYFGASDSRAPLGVDATEADGRLVVYAVGGIPPYKLLVEAPDGKTRKEADSKDGWGTFALDGALAEAKALNISATDNRGARGLKSYDRSKSEAKQVKGDAPDSARGKAEEAKKRESPQGAAK